MGRRKRCVLAMACLFTVTPLAGAVHVIPAVDLPSVVPDSVRDQTARSLALGRDTLGWALHPFRGEFHGLGVQPDGRSYANDLSADGRVVVGSDYDLTTGYRGYVWSPATGKVNYNLLPNGSTGQTLATTVSADGVYAAGEIRSPYTEPGFRWSLASRELISPLVENNFWWRAKNHWVAALSGNGRVTVGTTAGYEDDSGLGDGDGEMGLISWPNSWAFRHSPSEGWETVGTLPASHGGVYYSSSAADVTGDGQTTLVNGYDRSRYFSASVEPFLWKADGTVVLLGQAKVPQIPGEQNSTNGYYQATTASALSSDGSTVVGKLGGAQYIFNYFPHSDYTETGDQAVLWREETGWIDLGDVKTPQPSQESVSPNEDNRIADDVNGNGSYYSCDECGLYTQGDTATAVSGDGSLVLGSALTRRRVLLNYGYFSFYDNVPFLWDEQHGMRDLEDVLSLDYGIDLEGWSLSEAAGISDDGTTIIGNGTNPDGEVEAWRAVLDRNTPDGDFDFDGDVDHHDYQTLKGNLGLDSDTYAVFYADGDLNADGRVDQTDSDAFLSRYENRWMGDFNADGLVDLADYTLWRDLDGLFTGGLADSNGDGWANQTDLAAWRTHFGMAVEAINAIRAQAVPEPAGLAGLLAGLVAAACHRRRAGRCERSA